MHMISKHYHSLHEKSHKAKDRINQETTSIRILKRKIRETKKQINDIDINRTHVNDKLNRLKQCSHQSQNKISVTTTSQSNKNQIIFRRLSVLIDNVKKACQKKLSKAEHILLLINQCHRLELDDENLLFTTSKIDVNQIHYLHNCGLEFDSFFDELSLFWKRFAHVQMDIYIRIEEKTYHKNYRNFFKKQLNLFL